MRKLASIKQISEILPIEGKDRIVLAIIDGWSIIVKKDEFKVGDKCVYVEIDSVLPETEQFEFLRKNHFRIKTMKMGGVVSQGICFPLDILPIKTKGTNSRDIPMYINGVLYTSTKNDSYDLDEDVTEVLGITQYQATMDVEPIEKEILPIKHYPKFLMRMKWFRKLVLPKKQERGFPSFISKTDETRIQNIPFILKDKREWIVTEKVDGQSGTFCLKRNKSKNPFKKDKFEYIVCSRNLRLWTKDSSSFWRVSDRYNIERALRCIIGDNDWVAIQGECVAPNVQGNKYKVTEPDLYVFNIIFPDGRLDSEYAKDHCYALCMKFVPILNTDYILPDTVNEVLDYAHGQSKLYDTLREGLVFRSKDGKQSFKAVDPLFLLKYDE